MSTETVISIDISDADVARIRASALAEEAKFLRRSVKKLPVGNSKGDIARGFADYLEGRVKTLRLEADRLDAQS